jgi:hypothetical protein
MKDLENKKYEGQALAITMVVLVISAILGLSIYSRSMKDQLLTLEERASAEALEVSDLTLERLVSKPIDTVVTEITQIGLSEDPDANLVDGIVLTENSSKSLITQLFRAEDIALIGSTENYPDFLFPICPLDVGGNEYQVSLKLAEDNYEIRAGHSWSLPAKDILKNKDNCVLDLNIEVAGDNRAGFVLSKISCDYDPVSGLAIRCDKYEVGSGFSEKYCFSDDGATCNNEIRFYDEGGASNWIKTPPEGGNISIPMSDGNSPSEVRITAVGGTVNVGYVLRDSVDPTSKACWDGLRMYQLRATANCSGVYRGKEILVPEAKWHDSLFDYVVFNNEGPI